jgi:hypothetical protein
LELSVIFDRCLSCSVFPVFGVIAYHLSVLMLLYAKIV